MSNGGSSAGLYGASITIERNEMKNALSQQDEAIRLEAVQPIIAAMKQMTDEERMEVIGNFCRYCGCGNPQCQCWNDE